MKKPAHGEFTSTLSVSPGSLSRRATHFSIVLFIAMIVLGGGQLPHAWAQGQTRGVGIYPGDPGEDFSPSMRIDSTRHRNLALHRPAYQSSGYDYNLTAQLVTDGIVESGIPGWIVTTAGATDTLKRNDREAVLDRQPMSRMTLEGSRALLRVEMAGGYAIPAVDSIGVSGTLFVDSLQPKPWEAAVSGSPDGVRWRSLGLVKGSGVPGDTMTGFLRRVWPRNLRRFSFPFRLDTAVRYRTYRVELTSPNAKSWSIGEMGLCEKGRRAEVGGPYQFTSAWKSAGAGVEWVYVDLGAECPVDRVKLYWIRRASAGSIQVSDDAKGWRTVAPLPQQSGDTCDVSLPPQTRCRYVRALMTQPASSDGYVLSEMEVFGTGGPVPVAHPQAATRGRVKTDLAGGAWKLQRASLVRSDGEQLSRSGYGDDDWIIATVPATVLVSYLNSGALPDPNFGDNQVLISESFFYSDFWYRDVFTAPASAAGRRTCLNFDGVNWKAEVFLNGHRVGRIEGGFMRGRFDVTDILLPGRENVIAVRIIRNDTPGFATEQSRESPDANGGELGADDPTFHATIGWDWIPTIRGRDTGIWGDVYLSESGPVTIEDPFVSARLPLPDTTSAAVRIETTLRNRSGQNVEGILQGRFGEVTFRQPVSLAPSESKTIVLDPSTHPSLLLSNPELWWPNGYGAPHLYDVQLEFVISGGAESDMASLKTGIREMTYSESGGILRLWVNGRRFIGRGGNWGFPESMLRYRAREYDAAVRYHREMNFTMIRNWVGQTGDDAFFDACDRHGIMVWQDFWLANPLDGPDPANDELFMRNAGDFVRRIRNHPSIGLYCGRNEGNPPAAIDTAIRRDLPRLHPGVHYIPNSSFGVVSGGGPYRMMPVKFYFDKRATEKLHSEIGMPAIVSYESLKLMMPDSALWPQGRMWGLHDFTQDGAQGGASFDRAIDTSFGKADNVRDWLSLAQWMNYQGYRGMFEAQSKHRMGLLLWMSHPAWPSMVWQTYDYYLEPTSAYFGCKNACEPLHIQWNPLADSIEVVNYSTPDGAQLRATMEILDIDGVVKSRKQALVNCPADTTVRCFAVDRPDGLRGVYFIRLRLERSGRVLSENFYWRGVEEGNFQALRTVPKVSLGSETKAAVKKGTWSLTTRLANSSKHPALMVRLKVVGTKSGERILPAIYSDNYISLMPGEERTIVTEVRFADSRGETPAVAVEGFNIEVK